MRGFTVPQRLQVRVLMNSSVEEVLDWKCCHLPGQNLEFLIANEGEAEVVLRSEIELLGETQSELINYLYPHGAHRLGPGESMSFYCSFDEDRFPAYTHLALRDTAGRVFRAAISSRPVLAEAE